MPVQTKTRLASSDFFVVFLMYYSNLKPFQNLKNFKCWCKICLPFFVKRWYIEISAQLYFQKKFKLFYLHLNWIPNLSLYSHVPIPNKSGIEMVATRLVHACSLFRHHPITGRTLCLVFITQSKSKTQMTRSVHCKFNCSTIKYNGTRHGIFMWC